MPAESSPLADFSISPRQYVADYHEGDSKYDKHLLFIDLERSGVPPAEYAKSQGFTRSANPTEYGRIYGEYRAFLRRKWSPGIKGLVELHRKKIFQGLSGYHYEGEGPFNPEALEQFNSDSKYFELLSFLSSLIYWNGSIRVNARTANYTSKNMVLVSRDMGDEESQEIMATFVNGIKELNLCTDQNLDSGVYFKSDGHMQAQIARLVSLFHSVPARKTEGDVDIPGIVNLALETLDQTPDLRQPERSRILAYNIVRDFVLTFAMIRAKYRRNWGYSGYQPSHINTQIAAARAFRFVEATRKADLDHLKPEIVLDNESNAAGKFNSLVKMKGMRPHHMQRIRLEMESRMKSLLHGVQENASV